MVALEVVLIAAVVIGIVSVFAWAIISDRRSKRASGGVVSPADAPLSRNLELPREMRRRHAGPTHRDRSGSASS